MPSVREVDFDRLILLRTAMQRILNFGIALFLMCAHPLRASNPEDLEFRVRLATDTRVYHMGESIEIEISHSSQIEMKYYGSFSGPSPDVPGVTTRVSFRLLPVAADAGPQAQSSRTLAIFSIGRWRWRRAMPSGTIASRALGATMLNRFHNALAALDGYLAPDQLLGAPIEKLLQGPIADALTHIGQIAMIRRLAGVPIKGENYFAAEITVGRVGPDQAAPQREFDRQQRSRGRSGRSS